MSIFLDFISCKPEAVRSVNLDNACTKLSRSNCKKIITYLTMLFENHFAKLRKSCSTIMFLYIQLTDWLMDGWTNRWADQATGKQALADRIKELHDWYMQSRKDRQIDTHKIKQLHQQSFMHPAGFLSNKQNNTQTQKQTSLYLHSKYTCNTNSTTNTIQT